MCLTTSVLLVLLLGMLVHTTRLVTLYPLAKNYFSAIVAMHVLAAIVSFELDTFMHAYVQLSMSTL